MGYLNEFPSTNFYDQDLGFLVKEYSRLNKEFKDFLAKYEDVIDSHITKALKLYKEEVDSQFQYVLNKINENDVDYRAIFKELEDEIDNLLKLINTYKDSLKVYVDNSTSSLEKRLKKYIDSKVIDVLVINYFTGEYVTIQEMFNYLCQFHLQDAIKYIGLIDKNITYEELRQKFVTFSELAIRGHDIL